MLPTGEKLPATGPHGLAQGMRFAETKLDDVFTDLTYTACRCRPQLPTPITGGRWN